MPRRLSYVRPFPPKFLVSGPAPPGRVLNYVRRLKAGDYDTLVRGPNDPRNLDHWTVCFMVGLGLVESRLPFPYGPVTASEKLNLTGPGERLFQLLRRFRVSFPEGSGPAAIRSIRRTLESRPQVYEEVSRILLDSPSLVNFRIFLASRPNPEVRHDDTFYREYGGEFGIDEAAFNRVPSVLQMAQLCGVVPLSGADTPSEVVVRYSGSRGTGSRTLKARVRHEIRSRSEDQDRAIDDLADDLGSGVPVHAHAVVTLVKRNVLLSDRLKRLYGGRCQICRSTFKKRDGENYSESHHVVPLGKRGADRLSNIVILCANCHRKMHYAEVRHLPPAGYRQYVMINGETVEIHYSTPHRRFLSSGRESSGR